MTDFNAYRAGNHINYTGPLTEYKGHTGIITSISQEEFFNVTIQKRYPNDIEHEIVAYPEGIRPILLNEDRLASLGFAFNNGLRVFERNGVNIVRVAYPKPTKDWRGNDAWMLDIKGYRLLTADVGVDLNERDVMANSVDVNCFHALQNYYAIVRREQLF